MNAEISFAEDCRWEEMKSGSLDNSSGIENSNQVRALISDSCVKLGVLSAHQATQILAFGVVFWLVSLEEKIQWSVWSRRPGKLGHRHIATCRLSDKSEFAIQSRSNELSSEFFPFKRRIKLPGVNSPARQEGAVDILLTSLTNPPRTHSSVCLLVLDQCFEFPEHTPNPKKSCSRNIPDFPRILSPLSYL